MSALQTPVQFHISGVPAQAVNGKTFDSMNPSTGERYATVALAGDIDVNRAVIASAEAFHHGEWAHSSPERRSGVLTRAAATIRARRENIAQVEAMETGKPITLALADVDRTASYLAFCSSLPFRPIGDNLGSVDQWSCTTLRAPLGVVGAIVPWNFAFRMGVMKTAPALALGNCVVLKTSELAPVSGGLIGEIMTESGLPDSVLNILHGDGPSTGARLIQHPKIRKITFTGSVATGIHVAAAAAARLIPTHLELGGKAPALLFDDADLNTAVDRVLASALTNSGQICTAPTRLIVQRSVLPQISTLIEEYFSHSVRVGNSLEPTTTLGPVISDEHSLRIRSIVAGAKERGYRDLISTHQFTLPSAGYFLRPSVFMDVSPDDEMFTDEIFGPVLTVTTFDTEEEAFALANSVRYGLSANVFTQSTGRRLRALDNLEFGTIWINSTTYRPSHSAFEPDKDSGYGIDGGAEAVAAFTKLKTHIEQI